MFFLWTLAVVILAALKGVAAQQVNQTEGPVAVHQGNSIFLKCSYESFFSVYLFWYVQHPGQAPELFLRDLGKDGSDQGNRRGFAADHNKNLKTFHMKKPTSRLSDSAVYFCAAGDTVRLARTEAARKHAQSKMKKVGYRRT
uniref:Uncharacterized protein n=1 Tax=Sphaerodactylus townsendi TaxID=933632 RepID=A0ACB8EWF3_9SAUR